MENITVTFTTQEANVLLQLLDLAVRQGGMNVAESAVVLANKIKSAAQEPAVATNGQGIKADAITARS